MPVKSALTDLEKQSICALRMQGLSNRKIADKLGLHPVTVSKVYRTFLREASPVMDDLGEWQRDVKTLAVKAVKRGLSDESDHYKAGTLGVQALKGLGELTGGQPIQIGGVAITFAWRPVQEPEYDTIDVAPKRISE